MEAYLNLGPPGTPRALLLGGEALLGGSLEILWFDSLGAKSSSICIRGANCVILVDPGAAEMQPSYPLPKSEKSRLRREAALKIRACLEESEVVIITHYHWDHAPRPGGDILVPSLLRGKLVLAKNPNIYINESQWKRARKLYAELGCPTEEPPGEPGEIPDPLAELPIASSRRFPGYDSRRAELLSRGRSWFKGLWRKWWSSPWISEGACSGGVRIRWIDSESVEVCGVHLRFTPPWFHGVEFDRTGWVVGFEASLPQGRLFYSSDVMGPIIEDYAEYIAGLRPDVLVLDGPPTYLYPYMFNRINLGRAVDNGVLIVESGVGNIIYDHHLLREARWRERVRRVLEAAAKSPARLATAAEYLGRRPLIDELAGAGRHG